MHSGPVGCVKGPFYVLQVSTGYLVVRELDCGRLDIDDLRMRPGWTSLGGKFKFIPVLRCVVLFKVSGGENHA